MQNPEQLKEADGGRPLTVAEQDILAHAILFHELTYHPNYGWTLFPRNPKRTPLTQAYFKYLPDLIEDIRS